MVIDFHTHVYPDSMASRVIDTLKKNAKNVSTYTDGTLSGLLSGMESAGIDKSVILPVATRKGQFDTINKCALETNRRYKNLVSFGGIHPDDDDIENKLQFLKDSGFRGIKIHPDYTGTFIDDERYIRIITGCARLGLIVVSHAGVDPAFEVVHCPPDRARAVLDRVMSETGVTEPFMVFAHLGGMNLHDDVMEHLAGANCYIDISCGFHSLMNFSKTGDKEAVSVIKRHGADRVLFATDSPWNDQKAYVEHIRSLDGISDTEKEMILYKNAERLLSR